MTGIRLSVNLNKVALLRNSRRGGAPGLTEAAETAIAAGAGGITVHPRPDQRHIRPDDVLALAELLRSRYPEVEFNMEGNPSAGPLASYPGFLQLVQLAEPHQCTLVPDSPEQLTSDHGFMLSAMSEAERASLCSIIAGLKESGIRVSLFMDPDPEQVDLVPSLGADRIELYTGPYAKAFDAGKDAASLALFSRAANAAQKAGLGLNAGHDLNQQNLPLFAGLPGLLEVSIGHALICEALYAGLAATVAAYVRILQNPGATPAS